MNCDIAIRNNQCNNDIVCALCSNCNNIDGCDNHSWCNQMMKGNHCNNQAICNQCPVCDGRQGCVGLSSQPPPPPPSPSERILDHIPIDFSLVNSYQLIRKIKTDEESIKNNIFYHINNYLKDWEPSNYDTEQGGVFINWCDINHIPFGTSINRSPGRSNSLNQWKYDIVIHMQNYNQ